VEVLKLQVHLCDSLQLLGGQSLAYVADLALLADDYMLGALAERPWQTVVPAVPELVQLEQVRV
jgi:hypothetical protein